MYNNILNWDNVDAKIQNRRLKLKESMYRIRKILNKEWRLEYYIKSTDRRMAYHRSERGVFLNARRHATRRYRLLNAESTLTFDQWNKILENQTNKCAICGRKFSSKLKPTKDHIVPVSKGGGFTFENVQALCQSCNSRKNANLDLNNIVSWGIY